MKAPNNFFASSLVVAFVAAAMATVPAKAQNTENPLFVPSKGAFISKTSAGYMYKEANNNLAMQAKNHAGESESSIGRFHQDFWYGFTDRLAARLILGYTQNNDISRSGLHNGRLGLNYRFADGSKSDGWTWDGYVDIYLSGLSKMEAELVMSPNMAMVLDQSYPLSFNYDGYSHGRYGIWLGSQLGKTWDKLTFSAFAEIERTFGNNNNDIRIADSAKPVIAALVNRTLEQSVLPGGTSVGQEYVKGLPASFNVDTASTWEYNAGIKLFYELSGKTSLAGALTYKHRATNTIEAVNLEAVATPPYIDAGTAAAITKGVANNFLGSLYDGWDEYIFTIALTRNLKDSMQLTFYGEYTFDDAEVKSQSGTNLKVEFGIRFGVKF
jgi:hypothetical protein